jgi:hypothetical protein
MPIATEPMVRTSVPAGPNGLTVPSGFHDAL